MFINAIPVLLFMLAVSVDSLTAGLSYGASKVHIKPLSAIFLVFVPSVSITLMTQIGTLLFLFPGSSVFNPVVSAPVLSWL